MEQINKSMRMINMANFEDLNAYNYSEWMQNAMPYVYFGKYNDYPSFLRTLYLTSPTHQAIVDNTSNLATGEGVFVVDPAKNPLSNKWLSENFPKSVIKDLLADLKLYGYCTLQIYGGNIVKYSEAIKYRLEKKNSKSKKIENVWFSEDWDLYQVKGYQPVQIPLYKEGCTDDISVLWIQLDKHGFEYYSPVDYNGGVNYIALESEISKLHLSNVKNSLFPSFLLNFIGAEFSSEEMDKIEREVNKKFSGSMNAGRAMLSFSASKDDAPQLTTIEQPQLSELFQFLSKESAEKILLSHGVTSPLLMGIRDTGGGLGSNAQELEQSFYLYYEAKLKHYQNYIIDMIRKVMDGNMMYADIEFRTVNPFKNTQQTQQLSKLERLSEIDVQPYINKIDNIKVEKGDILLSENIFNGKLKQDCLYKFVKASNNKSMIIKKFELLSEQGYVFRPDKELIKNTGDYFFMEQTYMRKIE